MVKVPKVQLSSTTKKMVNTVSKPKMLSVYRLTQFSGVEPVERLPVISKNFASNLSFPELLQKLADSKEMLNALARKSFSDIKEVGKSLFLDLNLGVSQDVLKKLRFQRVEHKRYLGDIVTTFQGTTKIPYTDRLCSDVPVKQLFMLSGDSMIMSPRLLAHYVKGENTVSHYRNVEKYKKLYSSCSIKELFVEKRRILNEFKQYTSTNNLIPDFRFSKSQIKDLKQLVEKYDAIDTLQRKQNINTNAIEALLYSGIEKVSKIGDILPNKDIMIGFSNVYDRHLKKNIPIILSFTNTDLGYRFKSYRYDEDLIGNIEKYKKQVSHFIDNKNYEGINCLNNRILEYLKTMQVSEVYIQQKDAAGLSREMEKCPEMSKEKIEDVLKNLGNDIVYFIKDLKNYDVKRYYNASNPLIKCLKEFGAINNINEVYTEALAFNNVNHSPVGMYMRAGFNPVSISKEEIEKTLYTRQGFDYKRSVWMVYKM